MVILSVAVGTLVVTASALAMNSGRSVRGERSGDGGRLPVLAGEGVERPGTRPGTAEDPRAGVNGLGEGRERGR